MRYEACRTRDVDLIQGRFEEETTTTAGEWREAHLLPKFLDEPVTLEVPDQFWNAHIRTDQFQTLDILDDLSPDEQMRDDVSSNARIRDELTQGVQVRDERSRNGPVEE